MKNTPYLVSNEKIEVDLKMVFDICDNDKSGIEKLVTTFLKTMKITLEKLDDFFETQDVEVLRKTAHAARSSLSVIQVKDLFDHIVLIEEKCREPNTVATLIILVASVKEKYIDVQQLLHERFKINI